MIPSLSAAGSRRSEIGWAVNPYNPMFWLRSHQAQFEETLCEGLSYVGPVIAIGRPNEELPKLGAARKYVADCAWKDEVVTMLDSCRFACLLIGSSEGVLWELQTLLKYGEQKVLLVLRQDNDGNKAWQDFAMEACKFWPSNIPRTLPDHTLGVFFCRDWQPVVVTGKPTIANYREIAWEMTRFLVCPETGQNQSPANK